MLVDNENGSSSGNYMSDGGRTFPIRHQGDGSATRLSVDG